MSSAIVGVMILVAAVLLQPSEASMVMRALSSRTQFAMPPLVRLVERREMSTIVDAVEMGEDFLVVDGGNRVGKSVSVEVAASRLSSTRTVRWSVCDEGDTAAMVLRRLFGLDASTTSLSRIFSGIAKLSPPVPPSVADIRALVLSESAPGPEPVLVVEMAERLDIKEFKSLLDFAKELVDKRRGRFVFVFSPTDKLDTIRRFGSLSRAKVIHVSDLSDTEAAAFLKISGCAADRTLVLYELIGGHIPHLVTDTVRDYCRGTLSLADVKSVLFAGIGARFKAVDRALGTGSACSGVCGVLTEKWPKPGVLDVLLQEHLVVAALTKGVYVDPQMVRAYVNVHCSCTK